MPGRVDPADARDTGDRMVAGSEYIANFSDSMYIGSYSLMSGR